MSVCLLFAKPARARASEREQQMFVYMLRNSYIQAAIRKVRMWLRMSVYAVWYGLRFVSVLTGNDLKNTFHFGADFTMSMSRKHTNTQFAYIIARLSTQ